MSLLRIAVLAPLLIGIVSAKEKPKITIRVVETQASDRHFNYEVAGTPEKSTTNCRDNSGYGSVITGGPGIVCNTTTTPATASHKDTISVAQANVLAVFPGDKHVTLWCQYGFRKCVDLEKGSYGAEVDGETVWVFVPDLSGKITKIKYRHNGGW